MKIESVPHESAEVGLCDICRPMYDFLMGIVKKFDVTIYVKAPFEFDSSGSARSYISE